MCCHNKNIQLWLFFLGKTELFEQPSNICIFIFICVCVCVCVCACVRVSVSLYMHIYMYMYKVKLATVVKGDPKAPFSVATTLRCKGEYNSFLWIALLYP